MILSPKNHYNSILNNTPKTDADLIFKSKSKRTTTENRKSDLFLLIVAEISLYSIVHFERVEHTTFNLNSL
jgi:hypothetical protein